MSRVDLSLARFEKSKPDSTHQKNFRPRSPPLTRPVVAVDVADRTPSPCSSEQVLEGPNAPPLNSLGMNCFLPVIKRGESEKNSVVESDSSEDSDFLAAVDAGAVAANDDAGVTALTGATAEPEPAAPNPTPEPVTTPVTTPNRARAPAPIMLPPALALPGIGGRSSAVSALSAAEKAEQKKQRSENQALLEDA